MFLCVKAHHTEAACRALLPHLAADGFVLSLQNGLNEEVIAAVAGRERTMGAFVNFQKLFGSQLSDNSALGPQIDAMIAFSSEVTNAGIKIEENLLALFIINCLPKSYAAVGSTILSASSDISKLKPGEVRGKIVEEESRRVANKTQISRVSTAPQHKKWCGLYYYAD